MFRHACLLTLLASLNPLQGQEVVVVGSGFGSPGSLDPAVTMLVGPANSGFPATLTLNEFAMASSGPPAMIVTPNGGWSPTLPVAPTSNWIATMATGDQETALFAVNFTVATTAISAVFLDFVFAVDDALGGSPNEGLYINTFPVSGSAVSSGVLYQGQHFVNKDVTALVTPGFNTLYVYQRDTGGAAGIIFQATVTVHSSAYLTSPLPMTPGGAGLIVLHGGSQQAGATYAILPSTTPSVMPGTGIPAAPGQEFLLPPSDPLLLFALTSPLAASVLPGMLGTISAVNNLGATPVFVPTGTQGITLHWQALVVAPSGIEVTNVLVTPIL